MSKEVIVTRDWITNYIFDQPAHKVERMIGRALVGLFKRQTEDEAKCNDTKFVNNVGFSGSDARSGSLTAKYYMKHKRLEEWQVKKWIRLGKNGHPRIARYHRQLNEIALERQEAVINKLKGI